MNTITRPGRLGAQKNQRAWKFKFIPRRINSINASSITGFLVGFGGSGYGLGALGFAIIALVLAVFLIVKHKLVLRCGSERHFALALSTMFSVVPIGFMLSTFIAGGNEFRGLLVASASYMSIALLLVSSFVVFSNGQLISLLRGYAIGAVTLAALGTLLTVFAFDWLDGQGWVQYRDQRLTFWMGPNTLAMHFLFAYVSLIFLEMKKEGVFRSRLLTGVAMFLLIGGIVLTGSRAGALLGVLTVMLIVWFTILSQQKLVQSLITLSITFVLAVFSWGQLSNLRVYERLATWVQADSIEERLDAGSRAAHWFEGVRVVRENFVFGYGFGGSAEMSSVKHTLHNAFLLSWLDGGLLSFCGLVGVFCMLMYLSLRAPKKSRRILLLLTVLMFLYLNVRTHGYQLYLWFPLAMIFGLCGRRCSPLKGNLLSQERSRL